MGLALCADDLLTDHSVAFIAFGGDRSLGGIEVTRPASAGVKLRAGVEEWLVAADTVIGAGFFMVPEFPGKWGLGAAVLSDSVLLFG